MTLAQQILESIEEGVFAVDGRRNVTLWNARIALLTGIGAEAIVGKPLVIYFSLQQHDTDDPAALTQEALAENQRQKHSSKIDSLVDFARWSRMFQIVR